METVRSSWHLTKRFSQAYRGISFPLSAFRIPRLMHSAATIDIQIASLVIADEEVPTLSNSESSYKTFLFNPKLCLQRVS